MFATGTGNRTSEGALRHDPGKMDALRNRSTHVGDRLRCRAGGGCRGIEGGVFPAGTDNCLDRIGDANRRRGD